MPYVRNDIKMINKCIGCKKEISLKAKRCNSCANKGERNSMFGVRSPFYIDGRTLKKYYCKNCGEEITYQSALYGSGKCHSCSNLGQRHQAWNKGIKNSTGCRSKEVTKDTIVKHHIYLKENSDETIEMLFNLHRSLHWKAYEYLVKIGLVKQYIKEFIIKYDINPLIEDGKIIHHIDCNRENNDKSNFLYLESRSMHNKLHQEAYSHLVRVGQIHNYIDWFFLQEKKNQQKKLS